MWTSQASTQTKMWRRCLLVIEQKERDKNPGREIGNINKVGDDVSMTQRVKKRVRQIESALTYPKIRDFYV